MGHSEDDAVHKIPQGKRIGRILWDTLKMMLFTKYLKENALAESAENFGISLF